MRYSLHFHFIIFGLFFFEILTAQPNVGLIHYSDKTFGGYTLFAPGYSKQTFLIDNCGYVINVWQGSDVPELAVYLLEDGSLLRTSPEFIEKLSWDSELLWYFNYKENGVNVRPHHDIEPLPNGNVLAIAARKYTVKQAIEKGRNPNKITNEVEIDGILEIEPTGQLTGKLIWEWSAFDHLVQDFDSTKLNFGNIAKNKRRLDINFSLHQNEGLEDWLHVNAVEYHPVFDQILFSSRSTSEIYIIDHSTNAAEVKTSKGGKSGKGGDFLWRWGNPQVYKSGTEKDRKLFGQHDPKWISKGHIFEGKISVFNNGFQRYGEYSTVHILKPIVDNNGNYLSNGNGTFTPFQFDFSWQGTVLDKEFWGHIASGFHALPNGNFLICEVRGRFFEVNPYTNEILWVYINPIGGKIYDQYHYPDEWTATFRAEKYFLDYPAFKDKDLTAKFLLEGKNSFSEACSMPLNIGNINDIDINFIQQNNSITIQSNKTLKEVFVFNFQGQLLFSQNSNRINFNRLGTYFLKLNLGNNFYTKKIIFW